MCASERQGGARARLEIPLQAVLRVCFSTSAHARGGGPLTLASVNLRRSTAAMVAVCVVLDGRERDKKRTPLCVAGPLS